MTRSRLFTTLTTACVAVLVLAAMTRCGGGSCGCDVDDDATPEIFEVSDVTNQTEAGDTIDTTSDTTAPFFANPADGRLYAAAGFAVITPTPQNHPQTILLGGTGSNRVATGVHDELEARALVLAQDDVAVVLVSLDLVGWLGSDVQVVKDHLAERGVDPSHVIVSSTHTHSAPDTMGIWGPKVGVSGRSPEYALYLADTIVTLVTRLAGEVVPVAPRLVETPIALPGAAIPNLVNDFRIPRQVNDRLTVLRLDDLSGATVATLVNWNVHPEAMIGSSELSADMPRWLRLRLENELGGTAVYLSGTVGGLQTILDEPFPARTEAGEPILDADGQPTWVSANDEVKAWSSGHVVAELAVAALEHATSLTGHLAVDANRVLLPFENPMMIMAMAGGIIPQQGLDTDHPAACGSYGCLDYEVVRVRFGALELIALPGEIFPETSVGREASTHDWGTDQNGAWGVKEYPAIEGYRSALAEGHVLMEAGLANTEIGYIVPASDYVTSNHPGYYEEYFCVSAKAEAALREGVRSLLSRE